MTGHATLQFHDLPSVIPIFPLKNAMLLPGGVLNLTIFEPRYLELLMDCLATRPRLIGMIQPRTQSRAANHAADSGETDVPQDDARDVASDVSSGLAQNASERGESDAEKSHDRDTSSLTDYSDDSTDSPPGIVPIYQVGCAGRISSFIETDDGRYIIAMTGISRFRIVQELPRTHAYRQIQADWAEFANDFDSAPDHLWTRHDFLIRLKEYFKTEGIDANWKAIEQSPDWRLLISLAMNCPFSDSEKQAILEAKTWQNRAKLFDALIAMAAFDGKNGQGDRGRRH
ncbi:MAG: LON peptidase substrate-binding domain-containing protein [Alphaproteobacteria bacterium]|nr:LON peptidase substrate-binding domain-containing protein [Alphaproteobacteria bacterium]